MKEFILNRNQKKILKNLSFLKDDGFYLAGGTALALQFGHRTSVDLDFYTKKHFSPIKLTKDFKKVFKNNLKELRTAEDTLWLKIENTDLSFFKYPYRLIRPLVNYETIKIASTEDIIAMKLEAIITRGKKRDFIDMYFIMKKYGIEKALNFFKEKYPEAFNEYNCITGLTYFEDAERGEQGRKRIYIYSKIDWTSIKNYIEKEVKKYQLEMIK